MVEEEMEEGETEAEAEAEGRDDACGGVDGADP